jgi:hypothetical protein
MLKETFGAPAVARCADRFAYPKTSGKQCGVVAPALNVVSKWINGIDQ